MAQWVKTLHKSKRLILMLNIYVKTEGDNQPHQEYFLPSLHIHTHGTHVHMLWVQTHTQIVNQI